MNANAGEVTLRSADEALNAGFVWAKAQALAYAHDGSDPVGLWYEAALPGREAFCMRDVAHHSLGAAALGLGGHTRNMMQRFAENISESRDYCTYWEITKDNLPAPVDYTSDEDFWYNLPANFDIIEACWRQYLWTGDRSYLEDPVLQRFYRLSVTEYVQRWDKDGDGVPEYDKAYGRRGLASYNEAGEYPRIGGDLLAVMIAGYRAYARMAELGGRSGEAGTYEARAESLRQRYESEWWDAGAARFYAALQHDGSFYLGEAGESSFLPLYYGAIADAEKRTAALRDAIAHGAPNVEGMSYLPDAYYRCGADEEAYRSLLALTDPGLERREYPEVSYCAVGAVAGGLMGIAADGGSTVTTRSRLPERLPWAKLDELPVLGRVIGVKHAGRERSEFVNRSGEALSWKAVFAADGAMGAGAASAGEAGADAGGAVLLHNGVPVPAARESDELGRPLLSLTVRVAPGETHSVAMA